LLRVVAAGGIQLLQTERLLVAVRADSERELPYQLPQAPHMLLRLVLGEQMALPAQKGRILHLAPLHQQAVVRVAVGHPQ
jgi:hypothetical protein